ncbi:hypothetical protein ACRRTK_011959 [Alexandromys fortis]
MFLCGNRERRLGSNAAYLHGPWREGCSVDGQEPWGVKGHSRASGMKADSGETVASYAGYGGFVFTMEDLPEIKGILLANEVPAASGAKAMVSYEVTMPSQNSGPEPQNLLLPGFRPHQ